MRAGTAAAGEQCVHGREPQGQDPRLTDLGGCASRECARIFMKMNMLVYHVTSYRRSRHTFERSRTFEKGVDHAKKYTLQ
jgi:hypothetical protein